VHTLQVEKNGHGYVTAYGWSKPNLTHACWKKDNSTEQMVPKKKIGPQGSLVPETFLHIKRDWSEHRRVKAHTPVGCGGFTNGHVDRTLEWLQPTHLAENVDEHSDIQ